PSCPVILFFSITPRRSHLHSFPTRRSSDLYPLRQLGSSFLGYSDSQLVDFTNEELDAAFERIKRLKKRFLVLNPTPSLEEMQRLDRKSTRLNSSHGSISYAVFCLKKKRTEE